MYINPLCTGKNQIIHDTTFITLCGFSVFEKRQKLITMPKSIKWQDIGYNDISDGR